MRFEQQNTAMEAKPMTLAQARIRAKEIFGYYGSAWRAKDGRYCIGTHPARFGESGNRARRCDERNRTKASGQTLEQAFQKWADFLTQEKENSKQ